jgi:hypothetical protein
MPAPGSPAKGDGSRGHVRVSRLDVGCPGCELSAALATCSAPLANRELPAKGLGGKGTRRPANAVLEPNAIVGCPVRPAIDLTASA